MRTVVLFVVYVLIAILLIPIIIFCFLVRWPMPVIWLGKAAVRLGQWILGISLDVSGLENVDRKESSIFMCNHLSALDGPLLFMIIPQPIRVILKKESFRIPIIGQAMRLVGFVPVDRKRLKGGKKSIDLATRMIREKGFSFLIFPEGTRSRDGKLQVFKRGGFFLALNSQADVVPVSIQGTLELMPKGSFFIKKGRVKINFHPVIPVQGLKHDAIPQVLDKVRGSVQSGLEQ